MDTPQSTFHEVNGIRMHVKEMGDPQNPTIIFLHGFPEFWFGWRHQIKFFAENGFHVLVPDLRGYGQSSKPKAIDAYSIDTLAGDITGLIREFGKRDVYLVGHDWGGALAWHLGIVYPGYFKRIAILNCPHPWVMKKAIMSDKKQMMKSWYMFFFQLPVLPETIFKMTNFNILAKSLERTSLRGTFSKDELDQYKQAWKQKGAPRGMLNWYRAMLRLTFDYRPFNKGKVIKPLKIIWGKKDRFLHPDLAKRCLPYCEKGMLTYLDKATHWLASEKPEKVNPEILSFFQSQS